MRGMLNGVILTTCYQHRSWTFTWKNSFCFCRSIFLSEKMDEYYFFIIFNFKQLLYRTDSSLRNNIFSTLFPVAPISKNNNFISTRQQSVFLHSHKVDKTEKSQKFKLEVFQTKILAQRLLCVAHRWKKPASYPATPIF